MIDEDEQDLAVQYVLGTLEGEEARGFAARLSVDAELRTFVDELHEATAALAHAAPMQIPPPALREKVLACSRGEAVAGTATSSATPRRSGWLPWAIAASLAVASALLWTDRQRLQRVVETQQVQLRLSGTAYQEEMEKQVAQREELRQTALAGRQEAAKARMDIQALEAEAKIFQERDLALQQEVKTLKGRDALAQITIATLTAQVATYAKAGVVVVWDAARQEGVIKLTNLPPPAPGKDYQLWVIDPKYPTPVSGGVVQVERSGVTRAAFHPAQPIGSADKFALSVEASGGAPTPGGPVVFLGN